MVSLKPCPFCELSAIYRKSDSDDILLWRVECSGNCAAGDCFASTNMEHTRELAAKRWNTRPIEDVTRHALWDDNVLLDEIEAILGKYENASIGPHQALDLCFSALAKRRFAQ